MPRIDAWDVQAPSVEEVDAGFPRGFEEAYELGSQLGSGGFGTVRVVRERASGAELAAKTIPKRLNVPNISAAKQAQHLENLKREVEVRHTDTCWGLRQPDAHAEMAAAQDCVQGLVAREYALAPWCMVYARDTPAHVSQRVTGAVAAARQPERGAVQGRLRGRQGRARAHGVVQGRRADQPHRPQRPLQRAHGART